MCRTFGILIITVCMMSGIAFAQQITVDHTCTDINQIPDEWITAAKENLHIVYQHTSHGSQPVTGMDALESFPAFGTKYEWDKYGAVGALDMHDSGIWQVPSLSDGDSIDGNGVTPWVTATRNYLNNSGNLHVNIVIWSWCSIDGHNIPRYLENMEILISEYGEGGSNSRAAEHPVKFVFMTGHAEGQGEGGFIYAANQQIRAHCDQYDRILYDFADIESYNPDGVYFYDRPMNDSLDYTDASYMDRNWAQEWIAANPSSQLTQLTTGNGVAGYDGCTGCAHSDSPAEANLNCVIKGQAFWWLFARLAGWNPTTASADIDIRGGSPAISIEDGDTTPATADGTNFGNADIDSGTVAKIFTIANTGTVNLTLNGTPLVQITGHVDDFEVTAPPPVSTIATMGITSFEITFDPTTTGLRQAIVSIASDDSDENPYVFTIQGMGITIGFGDVNCSGAVNLADAILALQIGSGIDQTSAICLQADVNGDAQLGIQEAVYALQDEAELR